VIRPQPISLKNIVLLWTPMAATWLMMSLEGPFLAAVIARLAEPKQNLAAFGVAFALAILVEAPVILMMSASTSLVAGARSFERLRNFTYALNVAITALYILFLFTPAYDVLALRLIGLPPEVASLTWRALVVLLPWPAAIGYRRFYQGLLIRAGRTRWIAYGTVMRILSMSVTGVVLATLTETPGAQVGAAALAAGVCCEAVVTRWIVASTVRTLKTQTDEVLRPESESYLGIWRFYYPLALMSTVAMAAHPVVTFFMGQALFPLESLAVLPVINALTFIFRSAGLAYQEVAISLLDQARENYAPVVRFAKILALSASGLMAVIAFTPLAGVWFRSLSGLSAELTAFAGLPTRILCVIPALSVLLSFQRATLVHGRRTKQVSMTAFAEVGGIAVVLAFAIFQLNLVGATAAALAMVGGRVAANALLWIPTNEVLRDRTAR
jgi:hypothetical protein